MIWKHHEETIEKVSDFFYNKDFVLGLIINGSLVRGTGRIDSDVDIIIIVDDEKYEKLKSKNNLTFYSEEFSDYENGYVDGKFINMDYLKKAAKSANEPTRACYRHAYVKFAKNEEIYTLFEEVRRYPEELHNEKLMDLLSQVKGLMWYIHEAERRQNFYLFRQVSVDLVLYGGRMILAYNKILYPYHKWFIHELENAKEKPLGFMDKVYELLNNPSVKTANSFYKSLMEFTTWPSDNRPWNERFVKNNELTWLYGTCSLRDS